jgi:hypothetical protein
VGHGSAGDVHGHTVSYVVTGVSVLLGAHGRDLYIAITTAGVGLLLAVIHHQALDVRLTSANTAKASMMNMLLWWGSMIGAQRRTTRARDRLVRCTEVAVLAGPTALFPPPSVAPLAGSDATKGVQPAEASK